MDGGEATGPIVAPSSAARTSYAGICLAMHRALRHSIYVNAGAYTLQASLTNHRTLYQHVTWILVN